MESEYWNTRWQQGPAAWDLGGAHPLFAELIRRAQQYGLANGSKVYIPGCGRAHEGVWLAQHGFSVVVADFASTAISEAQKNLSSVIATSTESAAKVQRLKDKIEFRVEDASTCSSQDLGRFDAVFDRAMYCALRPELRSEFVKSTSLRLKSGGFFLSLPFTDVAASPEKPKGSGPPFETTEELMTAQLAPFFEKLVFERRRDGATDEKIIEEAITIWKRL